MKVTATHSFGLPVNLLWTAGFLNKTNNSER